MREHTENAAYYAIIVLVIALVGGCNYIVREHVINKCEDRGGQVVNHPVYSEEYWTPGCVESRNS